MEEEVEIICERLSLKELEQEAIQIDFGLLARVLSKGVNCLLVKLLLTKPFNREAFKATMKKCWRLE